MTGPELAAALRNLAHLVELQRTITGGLQIEPAPGVTITVRVVAGSARSSGPTNVGGSAVRMRRHRQLNRGLFGDDEPSPNSLLGDAASKLGDASDVGGIMGGSDPDIGETSGKETRIPGINLTGQEHETREQRHGANSVTQLGDALGTQLGDASRGNARSDGTQAERVIVARVFDAWRQDTGHHRAFLDKKRGRRILARLRDGFTYERLVAAIVNRRNDPFLMGQNDTGRVYDGIETLLRDPAQVERLELLTEPMAPKNGSGARGPRAVDGMAAQYERVRELQEQEEAAEA